MVNILNSYSRPEPTIKTVYCAPMCWSVRLLSGRICVVVVVVCASDGQRRRRIANRNSSPQITKLARCVRDNTHESSNTERGQKKSIQNQNQRKNNKNTIHLQRQSQMDGTSRQCNLGFSRFFWFGVLFARFFSLWL